MGLEMMSAMSSLGGPVGSLLVASLGDYKGEGRLLLASGGISASVLLLFARTPLYWLSLVFLLPLSMANNAYMVTRSALLQTTVSPGMWRRIVGFWHLAWGLAPLGTPPAGALADRWGARFTVSLQALVSIVMFGGLAIGLQSCASWNELILMPSQIAGSHQPMAHNPKP